MPTEKTPKKSVKKAVITDLDAEPKKIPAKKKTVAKKPVKKTAKPKKAVDDGTEQIAVTIHKPAPEPAEEVEPDTSEDLADKLKVEAKEGEEIPEELLPTADELDLSATEDPATMDPEQMEKWFDDLDSLEAPAAEVVDAAEKEKLSQAEIDYREKHKVELEAEIDKTAPIESLVKPEPVKEAADEKGKLKGFIVGHAHGQRTEAAAVHQSAESARDSLASPKVFDTKTVHRAIDPSAMDQKAGSKAFGVVLFLVVLMILAAVYAAIDLGWLGNGIKVPFHIVG